MLDSDILIRTTIKVRGKKNGSVFLTIPAAIRDKLKLAGGDLIEIAVLKVLGEGAGEFENA